MRAAVAGRESNDDERMIVTMTIAELRDFVRQELQAVSMTANRTRFYSTPNRQRPS
jgi:hypothetical protein